MKIILGSASPQRKMVMDSIGVPYEIMHADVNEKAIRHPDPEKLTVALAKAKAEALLKKITGPAILITADLVVVLNGTIIEKPKNAEQARKSLKSYAHAKPETVAAVVVTNTKTKKQASGVARSVVSFKPIPDAVIEELIKEGDIFTQAGAFSPKNPLLMPYITSINGTVDAVMGLPIRLMQLLAKRVGGKVNI